MKQFFEQYGAVALGILALLVLVAMITPVGNIVKTSLQGTVDTFSTRIGSQVEDGLIASAEAQNSALNVITGGSGGGSNQGGNNPSTPSSEINFTVDGVSFTVDPGTTWETWVSTNTAGYSANNDRVAIERNSRTYLIYDTVGVQLSETIEAKAYAVVKMPIQGETLTIEGYDGLTFHLSLIHI